MAATKTDFTRVDYEAMPPALRKAWDNMQKAREVFEAAAIKGLQKTKTLNAGQEARFSYKLHGFHVAIVDAAEPSKRGTNGRELFGT